MCHNKKYKSINSDRILWLLFGAYCIAIFLVLFVRKRFNIGDEPYWEQVKMSINLVPFRTIYGSLYSIIHRTIPYLIPHDIISLLGNFALFMPFGYFIPRLFRRYTAFTRFVLLTFVVLLFVETLQAVRRGSSISGSPGRPGSGSWTSWRNRCPTCSGSCTGAARRNPAP